MTVGRFRTSSSRRSSRRAARPPRRRTSSPSASMSYSPRKASPSWTGSRPAATARPRCWSWHTAGVRCSPTPTVPPGAGGPHRVSCCKRAPRVLVVSRGPCVAGRCRERALGLALAAQAQEEAGRARDALFGGLGADLVDAFDGVFGPGGRVGPLKSTVVQPCAGAASAG